MRSRWTFSLAAALWISGASTALAQFDEAPVAPDTLQETPAPDAPQEALPVQPPQDPAAPPPVVPPVEPPPAAPPVTPPQAAPPDPQPVPGGAQAPYSPSPAPPADPPVVVRDLIDPFAPPVGLYTPPEILIPRMGFYGHWPFVYSPSNCFDLAVASYKYHHYLDTIALLTHAIEQDPQPHYYYLRGLAQLHACLPHDAIASADGVLQTLNEGRFGGLNVVRERFNGPLAVQFRELLKLREAVPPQEI
jgi:hypothetical protein